MNKVFNINLGGIVFTIDDVAFDKLNRYINKLKAHFGNTEGATDIIADIEARMAELLQQKLTSASDIVNEQMVDEVIAVMGDVNELDGEGKTEQSSYQHTSANENDAERKLRRNTNNKVIGGVCSGLGDYLAIDPTLVRIAFLIAFFIFGTGGLLYIVLWIIIQPASAIDQQTASTRIRKRLFRDADDKVISGVCAGIANYIGVDPVWVRIFFAIAMFVFGVGFWVYIALWIAVPRAITAAQKLQMKGDPIDVSNIEREVKNTVNNAKQNAPKVASEMKGFASRVAYALSEVIAVVFKLVGKLIAIVLLSGSLLAIGFLVMIYGGLGNVSWIKEFVAMSVDREDILTALKFGLILLVGVPLLSFVITAFRIIFNLKFKKGPVYTILGVLTFIGGILLAYSAIEYMGSIEEKANYTERIAVEKHDTLYLVTSSKEFDGNRVSIGRGVDRYALKINDSGLLQCSQELTIKKSLSDSMYVDVKKISRGELKSDALKLAETLQYSVVTNGSRIAFDEGIFVPKESKWKHPNVKATLRVPVGTIIIADEEVLDMLNRNENSEEYYDGKTFIMTEKGIKCLDCEDELNWKDKNVEINIEGDDDNEDENVNIDLSINEDDSSSKKNIHIITKKKNVIIKNGKKTEIEEKQVGPLHIKIEKSKSEEIEKDK